MSDYPAGSTAKQYFDTEGNILTLRQLIRAEPEWAHSRIVECERLERQLEEVREVVQASLDVVDACAGHDWHRCEQHNLLDKISALSDALKEQDNE